MLITAAHLLEERLLLAAAAIVALVVVTLLYLSWRVMAEKDLFATTNTIIVDFYRFIVEHIKKIYYLYKGDRAKKRNTEEKGLPVLSTATLQEKNNQNDYDREAH